ncbi:MAG: pyrimidine-nucleoside phosphorylase [Candidatus Izemoplasmatales bacterium]|nr:pyrimidine-nucleoside phosphorylase [Candidatus Izemoplasmatales bacterium]
MRMVDIIEKKRDGHHLTRDEIRFVIEGYVSGMIPDYQLSAWLMAIYFQGMNHQEAGHLTEAMLQSGDSMDLSEIIGIKVDKHSTGGVGDKTTLILAPLMASFGLKVAKLSGRGLGHTGGTLDKLESIRGMNIDLTRAAFVDQVNQINLAVSGQTGDIVPADKLLYALRDVTATVPSIPLIASSIMSKKLASGADIIALDVKVGDGAFMKTLEEARELSRVMVGIGEAFDKRVIAFLTRMEQPLGYAIGNRLEVLESIHTLQGNGPKDLEELCVAIASRMLVVAQVYDDETEAKTACHKALRDHSAYDRFIAFISMQGGVLDDLDSFVSVKEICPYRANRSGYIQAIRAHHIGIASMRLGGGRAKKEDLIDPMVGIMLKKKVGEFVSVNETLCDIYANHPIEKSITDELEMAFEIGDKPVEDDSIILEVID